MFLSSFLRTAGQTRGSPVTQRPTDYGNEIPWLPDNSNSNPSVHSHPVYDPTTALQRGSNLTRLRWPPPALTDLFFLWWALDCFHSRPIRFTRIPLIILIASIDDIQDTSGSLPVPLSSLIPGDIFLTMWQTKETSCEEHSPPWDDGIGPRRSQCLYLTGH